MARVQAKKRFNVGAKVRIIQPGITGTVKECPEEPGALGEYWHVIKIASGERKDPGCNLELVPEGQGARPGIRGVINVTNHLRDNARVNIHSTDQSMNTVSVTHEQLFAKIRDVVTQQIVGADQAIILDKLEELRQAQGTGINERYRAFIAAAANYMTIIAPFIPALTDLLHR